MNLATIKSFGGPVVGRAMLKAQKYAPEILTAVGIVGGVTAAVLGAKATLKLEHVIDQKDEKLEILNDLRVIHNNEGTFDEKEYVRDKTGIYAHLSLDLVKLYGPAVSLGVASIVSIVCAHGLMRRRNVALMAAYKTVETAYSQYRARVIEEFGAEKDADYSAGVYTTVAEDPETGKKIKSKNIDPNSVSGYARFFDESNSNWSREPGLNQMFLRSHQHHANDLLLARGHLFLNEVYDMLGMERSQAGQAVGWVLSKDGDNFVDFGIYNEDSERARAFVNGLERSILLDFNVDGVILDKI